MQRAPEGGRIPTNPARLVRKAKLPRSVEVRPLAPLTVERMRVALAAPLTINVSASDTGKRRRKAYTTTDSRDPLVLHRDAVFVSVLAYAGLRPGEARGLRWGDIRSNTILIERAVSLGAIKATKTGQSRTVRLLAPLAADLREWRMASGRPGDDALVFPGHGGEPWSDHAYASWGRQAFKRALTAVGVAKAVPYDLRHSFASLLLHEGRSVIYVARQLGHGAALTLSTYGHTIEELEHQPQIGAEEAILAARQSPAAHELPMTGFRS